jgi:hypothetical protein
LDILLQEWGKNSEVRSLEKSYSGHSFAGFRRIWEGNVQVNPGEQRPDESAGMEAAAHFYA